MISMAPNNISINVGEGSAEMKYKNNIPLASMQGGVVGALNSLRAGALVELDPAGQSLENKWWQEYTSGVKGNVMTTGWGEGTTSFNPHATLNWLPTHVMSQHARSLQALCSDMFHAYITGKQYAGAGAGAAGDVAAGDVAAGDVAAGDGAAGDVAAGDVAAAALKTDPPSLSPAAKTMQFSGRLAGGCVTCDVSHVCY